MAVRTTKKIKELPVKWGVINKAERIFNTYTIAGADKNWLTVGKNKDISQKQLDFIREHLVPVMSSTPDIPLLTDGTQRVSKALFYLTSRIAHSPMREVQQSSEKERAMMFSVQTALRIAKYQGYTNVHAYFLTLTMENADLGKLDAGIKGVLDKSSDMMLALKNGKKRGTGLRLPSLDGGFVTFLGSISRMEITVNQVKMANHDPKTLFHQHVHVILLVDGVLNLQTAADKLFDYWVQQHPNDKISRKGFFLEPCYGKNGGVAVDAAVAEANKYAFKPSLYSELPLTPDDFHLMAFCDLFKNIKHRQLTRRTGVFWLAQGYVSWLKKGAKCGKHIHSAYSAALTGGYVTDETIEQHVPDIYSSVAIMHKGKIVETRELSPDEMRFANRSLLQDVLWTVPDGIKWPKSDKGQLYKYLMSQTAFMNTPAAFTRRLAEWRNIRNHQLDKLLSVDGVAEVDGDACENVIAQINDLDALTDAVQAIPDYRSVEAVSLNRVYRMRALFVRMREHGCRIVITNGKAVPVFSNDKDKSLAIERQLAISYLSDDYWFEEEDHFINSQVCAEYASWCKDGSMPGFVGDDFVSYNMYCIMSKSEFQSVVDKLA